MVEVVRAGDIHLAAEGDFLGFSNGLTAKDDHGDLGAYRGPVPDAALSLSRLWQQHGKRDQARQLLTEVYNWFTEGFETPDLQEARVWLEASTG